MSDEDCAFAMKQLAEAAENAVDFDEVERQQQELVALGKLSMAPTEPDIPSCDGCGKEYSGCLARDIMGCWLLVLNIARASKAILLHSGGTKDDGPNPWPVVFVRH